MAGQNIEYITMSQAEILVRSEIKGVKLWIIGGIMTQVAALSLFVTGGIYYVGVESERYRNLSTTVATAQDSDKHTRHWAIMMRVWKLEVDQFLTDKGFNPSEFIE